MRFIWERTAALWRAETRLLASVLVIAGLLLAFVLLADEVMEGGSFAFDQKIILAFRQGGDPSAPLGPPWLPEMMRDITALGSFAVLGIVGAAVVGYLLLIRERAATWLILTSVLGGVVLNNLLKLSFARPRPDLVAPVARVFTSSFPSGHAALSAVTYLTLGALLARTHPSLRIRLYFIAVAVVLTLLVGVSRIYLGVHYPTDVLAGWCIGAAWALGCWTLVARLQQCGPATPSTPRESQQPSAK
jgi:undecaprenyl-diphosphatase